MKDCEDLQAAAAIQVAGQIRSARAPLEVTYLQLLLEFSCETARRQQSREPGRLILPG